MLPLVVALLSWSFQSGYVGSIRYYFVSPDLCDVVRTNIYEDWMFTWQTFDCPNVHTMVRHAFDAWQYNSDTVFYETRHHAGADVLIDAKKMDKLAISIRSVTNASKSEISMDLDACWYTDREFCAAVHHDLVPASLTLSFVWGMVVVFALYTLCHRTNPNRSIYRLIMWVVVLSFPVIYVVCVLPCLMCHDFTTAIMHEVGHVLGFDHSNDGSQMCGCGGLAVACAPSDDPTSIMHSTAQRRRSTLCLSRDDVDGVRSIYGGVCDDPPWCYELSSHSGYTRIATGLLYSFVVGSCIVFVRNRLCTKPTPVTNPPLRRAVAPVRTTRDGMPRGRRFAKRV
jgi:hypothetical protein